MAAPDAEKIAYLREFYDSTEIRDIWKACGDTQRDFAKDPLQIVSHSEAGESSAAIKVIDSAEAAIWMASAREAYRLEEGGTGTTPDQMGHGTDFSKRMTRV